MRTTAPAPERLRSGRDIGDVLRRGEKRVGRYAVVHGADRGDVAPTRVAVVASGRIGGAVRRNRAKRLLREAARSLQWRPGTDVVLVARGACSGARSEEVADDVRTLADELGVSDEH